MKKQFSPLILTILFSLLNIFSANAQKKKNAPAKRSIVLQKVKKLSALDSLTRLLKGNLLLPFEEMQVQMPYGPCQLSTSTRLINPGITFKGNAASRIRSAWSGIVSSVTELDNMYVVIVQCGQLFFAYSNLAKPIVKENQLVSKGQLLGKMIRDDSGSYTTDFLLSAKQEINPTGWFNWSKVPEVIPVPSYVSGK